MAKYANPAKARGICDRCGFAFKLSQLREEFVRGRSNGLRVCPECWDDDHPQNWTGSVDATDAQALRFARPENNRESRRINVYMQEFYGARVFSRVGQVEVQTI